MSDKETPREENAPTPEDTAKNAAEENVRRPADQCHGRYLDYFRQSLASEGEVAYQRWGLPLFHSMTDEEVESQRVALGMEPTDALDFYNRGCLLTTREDFAGAVKAFERAAQLDPNQPETFYNLALAQEKAGDTAKARQTWQQYLERFAEEDDTAEVKEHLATLA